MESAAMAMLEVKMGWKLEAVVKVVRRSTVYAGTGRFRRRRRRRSFSFFRKWAWRALDYMRVLLATAAACSALSFVRGNDSLRRHVPRALRLNVNIGKYACCLFYIEHHCMGELRRDERGCV